MSSNQHSFCRYYTVFAIFHLHELRYTFATLTLENGMGVKTLSAMLGHVSAATTLDIYTHITKCTAAVNIDGGIGKVVPQEGASEPGWETPRPRRKSRE